MTIQIASGVKILNMAFYYLNGISYFSNQQNVKFSAQVKSNGNSQQSILSKDNNYLFVAGSCIFLKILFKKLTFFSERSLNNKPIE